MPFKHIAACCHRISRARSRITNSRGALLHGWPVYEAGLRRRGDVTLWLAH